MSPNELHEECAPTTPNSELPSDESPKSTAIQRVGEQHGKLVDPAQVTSPTALSAAERCQLSEAEATIAEAEKALQTAGEALLLIRDARLYRATHKTFDAYCREKWGFSRNLAHRQIVFAQVNRNLLPVGNTIEHERHARPLAKLTAEQQRQTMAIVRLEGKEPTAAMIEQAAKRVQLSPETPQPHRQNQKNPTSKRKQKFDLSIQNIEHLAGQLVSVSLNCKEVFATTTAQDRYNFERVFKMMAQAVYDIRQYLKPESYGK